MSEFRIPAILLFVLLASADLPADDAAPVFEPGAKPQLLQETGAGEGPAWHPQLGLLTSGDGHIMRRSLDGEQSVWRKDAGSNGLLFDRKGRLVVCEPFAAGCHALIRTAR